MTSVLSEAGYRQALEKLAQMEARLAALPTRTDVHPSHREAVERSYRDMIRQYRRDIKLYEVAHGIAASEPGTGQAERPGSEAAVATPDD